MVEMFRKLSLLVAVSSALMLSACASTTTSMKDENGAYQEDYDPLEPVNRGIYGFNRVVDKIILRPVASAYRAVVPDKARQGVGNVIRNLGQPVTFVNALLQGDPDHAMTTFFRFLINSTVGIGGIFDVASEAGLQNRKEDLGQTLGTYGVGPGPYLVLPIIGPSSTRDAVGLVGDYFADPYNYYTEEGPTYVRWGVTAVHTRSETIDLVDSVENTSLDPYATFRSAYLQKRASDIAKRKKK